jgi:hypothetical protein
MQDNILRKLIIQVFSLFIQEFLVNISTFNEEKCLEITLNNQLLEVFTKNFKETN